MKKTTKPFKSYAPPAKPKFIVTYQSERLSGKAERAKVRQALHYGIEPEPTYTTGKFWID